MIVHLICPDCKTEKHYESTAGRKITGKSKVTCSKCTKKYLVKSNVVRL